MTTTTTTTTEIIESRLAECAHCHVAGVHVDTPSGEIVIAGETVAWSERGSTLLLADERDGQLVCDACAEVTR